ncbi:unnamed protein product [Staurois parvus]|uniref:Uncharacterized protein n=1 Tax=Staurois parvus TaxID=386267 RepID=A0ABN9BWP7_9NEOB|nr:unnamed protein product [Staurois parvus]
MGPPTDPGPSGSARVYKWSVRPCPSVLWTGTSTHYRGMCFVHISCLRFNFSEIIVSLCRLNDVQI